MLGSFPAPDLSSVFMVASNAKVVSMDTDTFLWTEAKASADDTFVGHLPCLVYLPIVDQN